MINQKYPSDFFVDITGFCNLRCRLCPEGRKANEQPQKTMSFEEFSAQSQSFLSYAKSICLINWSEPFLNKDLFKIIKYIKKKNKEISVILSSNGNYFTQADADNLVNLSLDSFTITMSGITQKVYQRYHERGNLDKLLKTIDYITTTKERYKSSLPRIEIVYLVFSFNYISLRKLKKFLLKKLGMDSFKQIETIRLNYGYFSGTDLSLEQIKDIYGNDFPIYSYPLYVKPMCNRAHNSPAIRADGKVFPCCAITYNTKYALGDLKVNTFDEVWHSQAYQQFRDTFDRGTNQFCNQCKWYYPDHEIKMDRYLVNRIIGKLWLMKNLRFRKMVHGSGA